ADGAAARAIRMSTVAAAFLCVFFFQAEDGIRDATVTGVQTCALPISPPPRPPAGHGRPDAPTDAPTGASGRRPPPDLAAGDRHEIGRASCRERVEKTGVAGAPTNKKTAAGRNTEGTGGGKR